ncbi:hypothetical protein [Pseudoalteromonas undina]|uniref:Uncharacterized protein n=1 Tax=Pseudoalteromonas undina TaxID=43660 RepID=A0ACC6R532_9GAMM
MSSFSSSAKKHLLKYYNHHPKEVGSQLYIRNKQYYDSKGFTSTDCITYALNVMSAAFSEVGNSEAKNTIWKKGHSGIITAQYLVSNLGWETVYINADINHPADGENKHPLAYLQQVKRDGKYYNVPVHHALTNYRPTDKESAQEQGLWKIYKSRGLKVGPTTLNIVDYNTMRKVPFGFGVSNGGMHTWLFSEGYVYEVHWDGIGASLYEKTPLNLFNWLSGVIIVPKDSSGLLKSLPQVARHLHE